MPAFLRFFALCRRRWVFAALACALAYPAHARIPVEPADLATDDSTGLIELDSSTNIFTDLNIGSGGYLIGTAGDVFVVLGNFTNASTQNLLWSTGAAEISFKGGAAPHLITFAGTDLGPSYFGFVNNFAVGTLRLAPGQALTLGDGNATPGAALYATRVILEGGLGQVASITGNGASIYYDPTDAANAGLLAGAPGGVYPLAGGGVLAPVGAALQIITESKLANGHISIQGLGVPLRTNTLQASPDLKTSFFAAIGTVVPAADGTFTFDDPNASLFPQRFYRLAFP